MKKEAKKHHYIPQFILKNFAINSTNCLVVNKVENKRKLLPTNELFMEKDLYRDEINNKNEPTQIELDLAKFESEIAPIINGKFLTEKEIKITVEEENKLHLFFAIMALRSKRCDEYFKIELKKSSRSVKNVYKKEQPDGNFEDLWKRNLGLIVKCRSISEVLDCENIDPSFKEFMRMLALGKSGYYFSVIECDDSSFVLGECYPAPISKYIPQINSTVEFYLIYPISPKRAILQIHNGTECFEKNALGIRPLLISKPKYNEKTNVETIIVKHVFKEEIEFLNETIINSPDIYIKMP